MSRELIVAGGGIGGIAAALALHRTGTAVRVFERAPAFREIGAGMSLWPNATRVLRALGVLAQVEERAAVISGFRLLRPNGSSIADIPMGGFSTPGLCIHRADLHRVLRQQLPESCLVPDRTVASFSQVGRRVFLRFSDGSETQADGLIGADGIHSAVRSTIHGSGDPVYQGYRIWRGLAHSAKGITPGLASETWGSGRRFGILPLGQGRVCWYATRNGPPARPVGTGVLKDEVKDLFKGWHEPVVSLIEATDAADIILGDARDRKPLRHWGRGRVTLLGDAAHPMTPNMGQGACMAIEDASCLAKSLSGTSDIAAGFRTYETLRKRRTASITLRSRWIGSLGQLENRWLVMARDSLSRGLLSHGWPIRLDTVYAYEA